MARRQSQEINEMKIGVTGGTGFIGRYILQELLAQGHEVKAWYRHPNSCEGIDENPLLHWVQGDLESPDGIQPLISGCDAVVHGALWRPGKTFRGTEGDLVRYAEVNLVGSLRLIDAAFQAGVGKFIYISTCAVHEKILDDRPLDEAHPLWPFSHYGAHKAAVEKFVHSYAFGHQYPVCAIRPTGVYGLCHYAPDSKYFGLVQAILNGQDVEALKGGKEVHAADVARGIQCLLAAPTEAIRGEAFNCFDRYISEYEVAELTRELTGSTSQILGETKRPKHEIVTTKIESLGMKFGGDELLRKTLGQLIERARNL